MAKIIENSKKEEKKDKAFYVKSYLNELKKVVWPTPKSTFRGTGVTLAMIFIVGVFVFLLDISIMQLFGAVMSISN